MKKHSVILASIILWGHLSSAAIAPMSNAFTEGERLVYTKVVQAFRNNQLAEAVQQRNLLAKNFPLSVHLDNAYYLTGVLHFQLGQYAEAVRDFGVVSNSYPLSNKRPAAMLAKAMTYQKLGLKAQSHRLLQLVVKEYPGSQESQRAWMQLKVASLDKTKR